MTASRPTRNARLARAALAALDVPGDVLNVGTGRATSVLELHATLAAAAGIEAEPAFAPARLGELQRSVLDVSRAAAVLGWRPEVGLEDGFAETWHWFTRVAAYEA
jgi:UDP-glucose 4-epimerase